MTPRRRTFRRPGESRESILRRRLAAGTVAAGPDECWLWQRRHNGRYGSFCLDGVSVYAHRVAYELATGDAIPADRVVMHACDQPLCVNPAHLSLGTQSANVRDSVAKGRHHGPPPPMRGSGHARAKLTDADVIEIRRMATTGIYSYRQIAAAFDIQISTVGGIVRRATWRHLGADAQSQRGAA